MIKQHQVYIIFSFQTDTMSRLAFLTIMALEAGALPEGDTMMLPMDSIPNYVNRRVSYLTLNLKADIDRLKILRTLTENLGNQVPKLNDSALNEQDKYYLNTKYVRVSYLLASAIDQIYAMLQYNYTKGNMPDEECQMAYNLYAIGTLEQAEFIISESISLIDDAPNKVSELTNSVSQLDFLARELT